MTICSPKELASEVQDLLVQLGMSLRGLGDDLGASLSPLSGIGNLDNVAALSLQLLQNLSLSAGGQLSVELNI